MVRLDLPQTRSPQPGVESPPAAAPADLVKALASLPRAEPEKKPATPAGEVRIEYRTDPEELARAKTEGIAIGKEIGAAETWDNVQRILREQRELVEAGGGTSSSGPDDEAPARPARPSPPPRAASPSRPARSSPASSVAGDRVKEALAWWASVGWPTPTREMLAESIGVSPNDRGFTAALGGLLADSVVRFSVPSGVSLVAPAPGPKNGSAVVQAIRARLSGQMLALYDVLLGSPEVSKVQLYKAAGLHDNGRSRANVAALAKLGIVAADKGGVVLTPWARGEKHRAAKEA